MYLLINTFGRNSYDLGRVYSRHRTAEAAQRASERLQRAVKRTNGSNSYLPTIVIEVTTENAVGAGDSFSLSRPYSTVYPASNSR